MRVTVNTRTVFRFPTGLANHVMARTVRRKLKKEGIKLTRKQISLFLKELKKYKKSHADWNIVEIDSKKGDVVRIRI